MKTEDVALKQETKETKMEIGILNCFIHFIPKDVSLIFLNSGEEESDVSTNNSNNAPIKRKKNKHLNSKHFSIDYDPVADAPWKAGEK